MDAIDALLLRADDEPSARSTMVVVYVLDGSPEWARVLDAFERASRLVPRLRQRVLSPSAPVSRPFWVVDEDFDLDYHVRRISLPGNGSFRDLLDFAQVYSSGPLDRARPLWEATLVDGLDSADVSGPAALVVKTSHALSDGIGGMAIAMALFTTDRDPAPSPMPPAPAADAVTRA